MKSRHVLGACLVAAVLSGCAGAKWTSPPPVIIAHRGDSGYLPEHTLAAYALAYGQGADVIEPDVAMTRDGVLVCVHDLTADAVTDVAEVLPGRARPDGKWYFADLTLAEVKRLRVLGRGERRPVVGTYTGFEIPTLDEMIQMVQELNRRTGRGAGGARGVGVIPEPKSPSFHRENGLAIEGPLVRTLEKWGYGAADAGNGGATIQCFELNALRRMKDEHGCRVPLMWTVREVKGAAELRPALGVVQGLGVNRKLVEDESVRTDVDIRAFARAHGLALYVWTVGDEPEAAARLLHTHRVDGVFIDFPDVGVRARDGTIGR